MPGWWRTVEAWADQNTRNATVLGVGLATVFWFACWLLGKIIEAL